LKRVEAPSLRWKNVRPDKIPNYGIIQGERISESIYRLTDVVEKPALSEAPSRLGIGGSYLMTPDLFDCIKRVARETRGEVQLTEAIRLLLHERDVYAHVIKVSRYDAGDVKMGGLL
jgi:UTP--glucose-1-phosphate uridylyltransferase